MACDLAIYLLKQGAYSQEGDVVILVSEILIVRLALIHNSVHISGKSIILHWQQY